MKKLENIIEALAIHKDEDSIRVLEDVGTNCPIDGVRALTAKALVKKNTHNSLKIVILEKGKGINDLNTTVAMDTINALLNLKDKKEAMKILDDTIEMNEDKDIRENARSVKTLMSF